MTERQQSVPAAFGRRLQREREARRWSLRDAAGKCGVSPSTINRAESGKDCALSSAIALAALYEVPVSALLAESSCEVCDGMPPTGFSCLSCGAAGGTAAETKEAA